MSPEFMADEAYRLVLDSALMSGMLIDEAHEVAEDAYAAVIDGWVEAQEMARLARSN
jgi:hypothetical protein